MVDAPDVDTAIKARAWHRCISLLRRCATLPRLRASHAVLLAHGLQRNTFALSRLIAAAADLSLPYASLLFRHAEAPPNSFIFNTLIRAHARGPSPEQALSFFLLLLRSPPKLAAPDHHTFPFVLTACASAPCLSAGEQIHTVVFKNGMASADHFVQTGLLRLYMSSIGGGSRDARKLFDEIPQRDPVHFDVLMNWYLRHDLSSQALELFNDMVVSGLEPDKFTLTTALTASAHVGSFEQGVRIHGLIERKMGRLFLKDTYICSALVNMYAKCGSISEAVKVFDEMPERNTHVWSAMIGGYGMHGLAEEAIHSLHRMQTEDKLCPDGIVLLGVLAACAHAGLVEHGLHLLIEMETCYAVRPEHEHYSCAVDMLCRVGRLEEAVGLIRQMPMRPLASVWGSLLAGCRTYKNVELAELAISELQMIAGETGDDEGVYVQLSNIYLNANRREEARRVRKMIGAKGIRKASACSVVEVEGVASSFVAGDQAHAMRVEIGRLLGLLMDHISQRQEDLALECVVDEFCF